MDLLYGEENHAPGLPQMFFGREGHERLLDLRVS
jgi:hypothetical protein